MKRLWTMLLALGLLPAASWAQGEEEPPASYRCAVKHQFDGQLDIAQTITSRGEVRETEASWLQPNRLYDRTRPEEQGVTEPSYMTISVNSMESPAAEEPGWFGLDGAKVQITVVTKGKIADATQIVFRRPSAGDRSDGLAIVGRSSRHVPWTMAALPYRVFAAFAGKEPVLSWSLLKWTGGDAEWTEVEKGIFDLRKVEAFGRAAEDARPALAGLRANYRDRCLYQSEEYCGEEM